jgi:hypothetical protein
MCPDPPLTWFATGPPREAQKIFPIQLLENGDVDIARNKKIVQGQKFEILGKVDPNPVNVSRLDFAFDGLANHARWCSSSPRVCFRPRQGRCKFAL